MDDLVNETSSSTTNNNKATSSTTTTPTQSLIIETEIANIQTIRKEIGNGPCRFAPSLTERTLQEQIDLLSMEEKMCFHNLKIKWEENADSEPFISDDWYLRFARCSPGPTKYNEKSAWIVMSKFNRKYDKLTAELLEQQLLTKVCFPIFLFINVGWEISCRLEYS
jgi:hypothetical protein